MPVQAGYCPENVTGSKEKTVTRLTPFLLIAALAGCTAPLYLPGTTPPDAAPAAPAPLPAEVAPFLPPGTPSSVVFQDASGCYLYSIERTDPPSGFPVRDASGRQICPGQPTTLVAPTAPPAPAAAPAPAPAPAPVTLVPTTPAPVTGGTVTGGANTIDGTAIIDIPAPAPLPVPLPTPVE
jgi:hypothetical protein